ncbi:MAG: MbnH family di-heme enzyme [Myxococcales bacterium]
MPIRLHPFSMAKPRALGSRRPAAVHLALIVGGLLAFSAASAAEDWRWNLPRGFPVPWVPVDNPMTKAKVELGRRLFFDKRLSVTGAYACASCHDPARAFTDGRAQALGATGEIHPRGTMPLVNVAYNASFGWANPEIRDLETHAKIPLFRQEPVELGLLGRESEVMEEFENDAETRAAFERAFPKTKKRFSVLHVRQALAAYQRTLISTNSAYDRYVFYDEKEAMSASAIRGMEIFFSDRAGCAGCHPAPLFMSPAVYAGIEAEPRFHNTGLYNLDGKGRYPEGGTGVFEHTHHPGDMGRFRVPTLRNVARTAPYMHDGSIPTLDEVVLHYASSGRNHGPTGERAARNPFQSPELKAFELRTGERDDLVAFLESLSDEDPPYAVDADGSD